MEKEEKLKGAEAFGVKLKIYTKPLWDEEKLQASKKMQIANEVARNLIIMDDPENCEEEKEQ